MTRLSQILAVGVITLAPLVASSAALAAGTCGIGFTGPDSNNLCTTTTNFTCRVSNNNNLTFLGTNNQVVASGTAASTGNTTAGSAATGSVTNSNGATFNATITNGPSGLSTGVCSVVATVPATPANGGKGAAGGAGAVVQSVTPAGGKGAVAALPNTSSDSNLAFMAGLIAVFGASVVISRLAVLAYSRIRL